MHTVLAKSDNATIIKQSDAKKAVLRKGHIHAKYGKIIRNKYALMAEAEKGLNASAIKDLITLSGFTKSFLAALLNLSVKTLDRYLGSNKKLPPLNSEMILKLFSLFNKGEEVFGSVEIFSEWLERPAAGLANALPITMFATVTGLDLLNEELTRIEYGDLG